MSIDHHIYVGPYLLVQNRQEIIKSKIHSCTNFECIAHGLFKSIEFQFCSTCGSEIANTLVSNNYWISLPIDPDRLIEIEVPASKGLLALISNSTHLDADEGRKLHYSQDDGQFTVEAGDVPQLEKSIFEAEFASEIAAVKAALGEGAVRVTWGVVSYEI